VTLPVQLEPLAVHASLTGSALPLSRGLPTRPTCGAGDVTVYAGDVALVLLQEK
jgi:hypothetical protein